jgi:hypothetical protein
MLCGRRNQLAGEDCSDPHRQKNGMSLILKFLSQFLWEKVLRICRILSLRAFSCAEPVASVQQKRNVGEYVS